jgi:hypothetical protein
MGVPVPVVDCPAAAEAASTKKAPAQQPEVLPKSPIGEAVAYALNNWSPPAVPATDPTAPAPKPAS